LCTIIDAFQCRNRQLSAAIHSGDIGHRGRTGVPFWHEPAEKNVTSYRKFIETWNFTELCYVWKRSREKNLNRFWQHFMPSQLIQHRIDVSTRLVQNVPKTPKILFSDSPCDKTYWSIEWSFSEIILVGWRRCERYRMLISPNM
jgi:hypothetical protein